MSAQHEGPKQRSHVELLRRFLEESGAEVTVLQELNPQKILKIEKNKIKIKMIKRMLSPQALAYTCRYCAPLNNLLTFVTSHKRHHHRHSLTVSAPSTTLSCLLRPSPRFLTGNCLVLKMEVRIPFSLNSFLSFSDEF